MTTSALWCSFHFKSLSHTTHSAAALSQQNFIDYTRLIVRRELSTAQPRKTRARAAPIVLTENAAKRIKTLLAGKEEDVVGVKVSVRRRGCNGYSYTMNYATKDDIAAKKDEIVDAYGVTVLVDPKAVFFLVGTVMDFEETELSSEFTFNNPNSKGSCGCGESFNV